jgi:integrase
MSYIADNTTRVEFLAERKIRSRQVAQVALNQFDIFCKSQYGKDGDIVIQDIKDTGIADKAYTIMNQFCMWLGEDHLELQVIMGKSFRPMRKRQSMTIRGYLIVIKAYFEEFGGIEINDRRFKKRVKQQKRINYDPEPFTHEEIRLLCDTASLEKKLLYMVLKDTGMRLGEAVHLYKEDIDLTVDPIRINIRAETTKTSTARAVYLTSETAPILINKIKKTSDGEKIFATNKDHLKAVSNETLMMTFYREKIGGVFLEKYSHNGRHKKIFIRFELLLQLKLQMYTVKNLHMGTLDIQNI